MFDADEPISDYQKVIRERASQSLGPLRYAFNSPVKSPGSRKYKGDSYSSAVTRLKTLLQQYNDSQILEPRAAATSQSIGAVPDRSHLPNTDEVTQLLNNQFIVLQYLEDQVEFYKDALESLKQRAELVITENENLFDQLKTQAISQVLSTGEQSKSEEQFPSGPTSGDPKQGLGRSQTEDSTISGDGDDDEVRQGQGTLPTVLHEHSKAQPVRGLKKMDRETMSTKELGLHDVVPSERDPRKSLMPSVMQRSALESSFGISNLDSQLFMSANERKFVNQLEEEVEKIRKLHEAKTRHLESLLYSTRDELEDYQRQLSELQAKLRAQKVLEDQRGQPALCVKCGHHSAVLSNTHSEAAIDTINQLTKERDDLMNMLTGQKAVLAEVRQREFEAYNQVKKSCNMVEQAQLEKAEAIIHVRQLREDLRKERERHENSMRMFSEKMDMERKKVQEACREEVSGLVKQIESLREARSALENQLERLTREKVDLMAELEQANSQILANVSEISKANETMEKELEQTQIRLSTASQELHSVKATAQQAQREREQERTRLTSEMDELRRRLQEAEHSWMECKEDCIRFTERLNTAEREAKGAIAAKEKLEKTRAEDFEQLRKQSGQRDEQLTTLLQETETRHTQCRTELQQMLEAEIQVCNKMKEECKRLTQQLEDSAEKSRAKVQDANKECSKLKKKLDESVAQRRTVEEQNTKKDKRLHELQFRLKQSDENARKQVDQMCQLLATRNNLMKERKILSQEVEFLRKQLIAKIPSEPVTPFMETASNSSAEDPGRITEAK
ncbi:serologically defined colon cancer antigen 8 homolog [Pocillopora verrucosa]|uniref:serologically defined colon cancer antigen 8 homolog n=1 Tax=Pocillopora verrucosa TaxID=203993 RepID=UPI00333EE9C7